MGTNDKFIVHYSEGRGSNLGNAKNKTLGWGAFRKLFGGPTRTKERFIQYMKMDHQEQVHLKAIDGWIYRTHVNTGKRNAHSGLPSDLMSLDIDYATPELMTLIEMGLILPGIEYFAHSSRRHTEENPRIRIYLLFSRPVINDEYAAISRIVAQKIDPEMKMVDKVSFRPAQMMFKPTACIDGDWFFYANQGEPLDPDAIFKEFVRTHGDWRNINNLPKCEGEEVREHSEKAEDPTEKVGPVGDFCRAYDVISAIDHFELPYTPTDDHSAKPRYTYTRGTTSNGAVVEDDGLFLYSHHGTDPCADMLVNAFDLVRIHKFGNLDEKSDRDTPMAKLPSWKEMVEFIQNDDGYKRQQAKSKYDQAAMFDDVMEDYIEEAEEDERELEEDADIDADIDELVGSTESTDSATNVARRPKDFGKKKKPEKDWFPGELELDRNGNIVQNLPNAQTITYNDPRLFGAIAYDEFTKRIVLRRDILSSMASVTSCICADRTRGDVWQDRHDLAIRSILAAPNGTGKRGYGMDKLAERDLADSVMQTALRNSFHPIKDWLWACEMEGWDGTPRIENLFIEYLGCPDTPYYRQTARMMLIASVTRIFEPGHKFDFSPVLEGGGGIRKSSFIEYLYGKENFGELKCDLGDTQKIAESIAGAWTCEFPEMTAFNKSDYNDAKQFLSAKQDMVRMAYDRRVSVFPRQATFWGTTNNTKYLKDPTGNRRWWPIEVSVTLVDTDRLERERAQIWAEAFNCYKQMRAEQPHGDLPLYLSDPEARAEAEVLQNGARQRQVYEQWVEEITDWLDSPISLQQLRNEYGMEKMPDPDEDDPELVMVQRIVTRDSDIMRYVLREDGPVKNQQVMQNFDSAMGMIRQWDKLSKVTGKDRTYCFGVQARWKVRGGATPLEMKMGYRILPDDDDLI